MEDFNNSFALLIGASSKGEEYMAEDAKAIKQLLLDKRYAGYPEENVILLTDKKATRNNILKAFDDLAKKLNKDSNVILFYSGHGDEKYDKKADEFWYFLKLAGITDKNFKTHWVKAEELKEKINALIADRIIFFFDCCHAQGLTKGKGILDASEKLEDRINEQGDLVKLNPEGMLQNLDDEEGMAIISACKDEQKSYRLMADDNSIFTTCLLEVLRGEHQAAFVDPYIRLTDVIEYVLENVPKKAKTVGKNQKPFVNIQFDYNFELSKAPVEKIISKESFNENLITTKSKVKKSNKKVFYESPDSNNAIIFVHGFSGEAWKTFGKIPDFLAKEERMEGWDMFPFGFSENVDPKLGKEVFASISDIERVAENLSASIKHKFGKYKRIAIVAYSLGGLVAQRSILNLNAEHRDRLSHVILFGTPSNGITHNVFKKIWKNKIEELVHGSTYIKQLREDWLKEFNDNYPFTFKTVAATRDEYVSKESALEPFKKEHWENICGDHTTMVKVTSKDNDGYELILNTLTNNPFFNKYTNDEEINIALGEYDEVVRKLRPALDYLNSDGLEKLIYAMECSGLREEAIEILETHEIVHKDGEMLYILGGLFKNEYLNNTNQEDGLASYNCYKKALRIAKKTKDVEQIYLNAINLAFLNLLLQNDKRDMRKYAKLAIEFANKDSSKSILKLATIGEASIYLKDLENAKEFYFLAAKKADIRNKIVIHSQAFTAYNTLYEVSPDDAFVHYLKEIFLS
jgi:pimeloyl-ACP methyl ester carboxylesterase